MVSDWVTKQMYHNLDAALSMTNFSDAPGQDCQRAQVVYEESTYDITAIQFAGKGYLHVDYEHACNTIWNNLREFNTVAKHIQVQILQDIDVDTFYTRVMRQRCAKSGPIQTNHITRRFRQNDRCVLVWASVEEDEMFPLGSDCLTFHMEGWYVSYHMIFAYWGLLLIVLILRMCIDKLGPGYCVARQFDRSSLPFMKGTGFVSSEMFGTIVGISTRECSEAVVASRIRSLVTSGLKKKYSV